MIRLLIGFDVRRFSWFFMLSLGRCEVDIPTVMCMPQFQTHTERHTSGKAASNACRKDVASSDINVMLLYLLVMRSGLIVNCFQISHSMTPRSGRVNHRLNTHRMNICIRVAQAFILQAD